MILGSIIRSGYLLLCGAAVQQCGWWSLYGDLGLWCGLVGGAVVLAGAVGFDCALGHNWKGDNVSSCFGHPAGAGVGISCCVNGGA